MSVLIKGMEMPTSCERCPMLDWDLDYIKCKVTDRHFKMTECWRAIRVPDCPLVPVPPHGRLIDADALMLKIQEYIEEYGELDEHGWHNEKWCAMKEAAMSIDDAPTIIPAKEGEI